MSLILSIALSLLATGPGDCGAPVGSADLLEESTGRILLVGELHGTEQAPAFAASLACLALERGESVVLGLEQSAGEQERIDRFLQSDGSDQARQDLFDGSYFWNGGIRDGRSSEAMLALMDTVRQWRGEGASLDLVALDYDSVQDGDLAEHPDYRDAAMSRRALASRETHDRVIVLVGNIHARRTPFISNGRELGTIGSLSPPESFVAVNTIYGSGSSWSCRSDGQGGADCGVHENTSSWSGPPRRVYETDFSNPEAYAFYAAAYDVLFYLGEKSASLPAVPQAGEE